MTVQQENNMVSHKNNGKRPSPDHSDDGDIPPPAKLPCRQDSLDVDQGISMESPPDNDVILTQNVKTSKYGVKAGKEMQ